MERVTEIAKCTGCAACSNICPTQSIRMEQNEEGFLYSKISSDTCINCGLCEKTCPVNYKIKSLNKSIEKRYAFQAGEGHNKELSTAGGFFATLAGCILAQNGVVCGVGYGDNIEVIHRFISSSTGISELCGSKYVQSKVGDTIQTVGKYLINHTPVLFVGTPCQIAGLYSYLSHKNIEKCGLVTIQLKCYGVSSPGVFEKFINYLEVIYDSKISKVNFRDKEFGYSASTVSVLLKNGKRVANTYSVRSYSKTFFAGLNIRTSCYNCQFREIKDTPADFVVGDFRNIGQFNKNLDDDKGTTMVNAMSEKGINIIEQLGYKSLFEIAVPQREDERDPIKNELRKAFFDDYNHMSWGNLSDKYCKKDIRDFLVSNVKPIINKLPFSKMLFKLISKINAIKYILKTK